MRWSQDGRTSSRESSYPTMTTATSSRPVRDDAGAGRGADGGFGGPGLADRAGGGDVSTQDVLNQFVTALGTVKLIAHDG
jgi:hypothetical protein